MSTDDRLELSPRKNEYIKFLDGKTGPTKTNDIAAGFGVDPSTITKTVVELAEEGFVDYVPYHGVVLSAKGKTAAEFLVKRHRILALALTHFGLSREDACREVSKFESFVSKNTIDQMCRAMGHPNRGICGDITHDEGCLRM
ncbi:MAG TPA: metal-dependent transcriptional regulator [Methanoregula sp.]|nr:metal-dependent transcriptional regulator [Methanoregula sp.]